MHFSFSANTLENVKNENSVSCGDANLVIYEKMKILIQTGKLDDNWKVYLRKNKELKYSWVELISENKNDPVMKFNSCISEEPILIKRTDNKKY